MSVAWQVGIGIAAAVILWWGVPKLQMLFLKMAIEDPKARAEIEDAFRKTVGQALGGIAVLMGAWWAYSGTQQTLLANQEQSRLAQQASHDLLISNQVAKGFEDLGNKDAIMIRLGGIYALEGVMNASAQYHQPVVEGLCAFVREGTSGYTGGDPPATDIRDALAVIVGRGAGKGTVDLRHARIPKANLSGADLIDANLTDTTLNGANLVGAHLEHATLTATHLNGAFLPYAHLNGAYLGGADLTDAFLQHANLTGAQLIDNIPIGPHLPDAKVSQAQLDQACGVDALLPAGLTLKLCPPSP